MMRSTRRAWALGSALTLAAAVGFAQGDNPGRALIGRLMAPCCWTESLASHDSPTAHALRAEINTRAAQGEPLEAIERDVVARYGARVRAAPPGSAGLATATLALVAVVGIGLAVQARRWARARRAVSTTPVPSADAGLDARVQAELDALETA